jgi:hypothetical protein
LGKSNEGLVFIDKALALDPKNADILDSKGFALDGLGKPVLSFCANHDGLPMFSR